jgi:hypothetical protein
MLYFLNVISFLAAFLTSHTQHIKISIIIYTNICSDKFMSRSWYVVDEEVSSATCIWYLGQWLTKLECSKWPCRFWKHWSQVIKIACSSCGIQVYSFLVSLTIEFSGAKYPTILNLKISSFLPFVNSSIAVRIPFDSRFRTLLPTNNKKRKWGKYVVLLQSLTLALTLIRLPRLLTPLRYNPMRTSSFVLPNRTALRHIPSLHNGSTEFRWNFAWNLKRITI